MKKKKIMDEKRRFRGMNVPIDLDEKIATMHPAEGRTYSGQVIQLLREAIATREAIAKAREAYNPDYAALPGIPPGPPIKE